MCPCDLFDVTYCLLTVPVNATHEAVGDNKRIHARIVGHLKVIYGAFLESHPYPIDPLSHVLRRKPGHGRCFTFIMLGQYESIPSHLSLCTDVADS